VGVAAAGSKALSENVNKKRDFNDVLKKLKTEKINS
jgi:hypothetical protein